MDSLMTSLSKWFSERPQWFQIAATQFLQQSTLTDNDISGIAIICQQEAEGSLQKNVYPFPTVFSNDSTGVLRLSSIGDIEGVNALSPKRPLEFGKSNVTVVYGVNGSGKSGYVRLLKHICGARNPGTLHYNVYKANSGARKACISFECNGKAEQQIWTGEGICDALNGVDIFDATFGKFFMTDESEVSYEPPVLSFFSSLIDICERVTANLEAEANRYQSSKVNIPAEMRMTEEGAWYDSIGMTTTPQDVDKHCTFNESHAAEIQTLQQRLAEQDPAEKAKQLKRQKQYIDVFIANTKKYFEQLSDKNCKLIITKKKKWEVKKKTADLAAEKMFADCQLEGIGSDTWKALWEIARSYSISVAYKELEYPNIADGARCILCHQTLDPTAKKRFISFEAFVKGELQKSASEAFAELEMAVQAIDELPNHDSLEKTLDLMEIHSDVTRCDVLNFYEFLHSRKTETLTCISDDEISETLSLPLWFNELIIYSKALEDKAENFEEDAKADNRKEIEKILHNLQTRKWLSENRDSINNEIERIKMLVKIQEAKKSANTKAISQKKGELAEALITDAFVQRFNEELCVLGASNVKVELKKTKVSKGRVLHKLQLKNAANGIIGDVLSEGESRIVSIAAFLADVTGKNNYFPFIFDDPISSLDQMYEEAVVRRLLRLSQDRQVIVFTHRLSLLGTVTHYAKKYSISPDIIGIRSGDWGTGEPASIPLSHSDIKSTLNTLMEHRWRQAKKANEMADFENAEVLLKSICSDFRIIIERSIENDLLCGIVERFQRPVSSQKLKYLSKLRNDDWVMLDSLMTKYSGFEHSQPLESPVALPNPEELLGDMTTLKEWREEYQKRPIV